MSFAMEVGPDKVVLCRHPLGAIGLALAVGVAAIAFGITYAGLGSARIDSTGPLVFVLGLSAVFCLAGLALLTRLAGQAGAWLRAGRIPYATATRSGLTLAEFAGSQPREWSWTSIERIAVAGRLKIVDRDGIAYCGPQLIVILKSGAASSCLVERASHNIGTTGDDRSYLSVPCAAKDPVPLAYALRALAPPTVPVEHFKTVCFDAKTKSDTYSAT